jgi:hypothetical protein
MKQGGRLRRGRSVGGGLPGCLRRRDRGRSGEEIALEGMSEKYTVFNHQAYTHHWQLPALWPQGHNGVSSLLDPDLTNPQNQVVHSDAP